MSTYPEQLHNIENGLDIYALGYGTLPASHIYDQEALNAQGEVLHNSHIYMIGYTENISLEDVIEEQNEIITTYKVVEKIVQLRWDKPPGYTLKKEGKLFFLENNDGKRTWIDNMDIMEKLKLQGLSTFDVLYIGQAYGTDGSRTSIDRLLQHKTLQKISLLGIPKGYVLQILLLTIEPNSKLMTYMGSSKTSENNTIDRAIAAAEKVFNLSKEEQISLYEAALIRYFEPKFNKVFKNSFPSTNHKILNDCYDKDFLMIVAEICIDNLLWYLKSEKINPQKYHIATFDLQNDPRRQAFFNPEVM